MKVVRRASLVLSLVLVVATAVGYLARTSALASERDASLVATSELGAGHLESIIDATSIAAGTATEPAATAEALSEVYRELGVCVVTDTAEACDGNGPTPRRELVDAARSDRAGAAGRAATVSDTSVGVYDALLTVTAVGPDATVVAAAPVDVVTDRVEHAAWATTLLPSDVPIGGFTVDQGVRQTSTAVGSADGIFVVAAGDDDVRMPDDEFQLYLVVFSLALVLMGLAGVTIVVEQRNLQERATFDPLTRLPNRSEFERRAGQALTLAERDESGLCLLLFDLNGFKQINDTYGHIAGDEMLKVIGARLRKAVRDHDIVARWGGDEFVVVMPGIDSDRMGLRRARELAEQIGGRTRLDGVDDALRVKVSTGVAIWPRHGAGLAELVVAADQAMYEAKREGVECRIADRVVAKPELVAQSV